jgi:hypothetical protein
MAVKSSADIVSDILADILADIVSDILADILAAPAAREPPPASGRGGLSAAAAAEQAGVLRSSMVLVGMAGFRWGVCTNTWPVQN